MVFANGNDPVLVDDQVSEPQARNSGEWRRVPIELLVGVVDKNHVAAGDGVRAAAILMGARPDAQAGWSNVDTIADENRPARFERPLFQPIEIGAGQCDCAEVDARAGNDAGRNR